VDVDRRAAEELDVRVVRLPAPLPPEPRFDVARVAMPPRYPGPVIHTGTETPLPW